MPLGVIHYWVHMISADDLILEQEGITKPVIVGQSMGGYVGQAYSEAFGMD